ncbi:unnamed protein product [Cylicocyclus nassatus]|uniref:Uncharacterized protein n=1 Tax=Cylicocyclus nassatus TaxID=53992 RepID=A0AA36GVW9_CYLNA|nr:unnamed protein product [Cylicocyclus nassatus]
MQGLRDEFQKVYSANDMVKFLYKASKIVLASHAAAVVLGILYVIPVIMITIGALNYKRCPVKKEIPVWLIVAGIMALIQLSVRFISKSKEWSSAITTIWGFVRLMLGLILLFWIILGSLWVYNAYGEVIYDNSDSENY